MADNENSLPELNQENNKKRPGKIMWLLFIIVGGFIVALLLWMFLAFSDSDNQTYPLTVPQEKIQNNTDTVNQNIN